MGSALLELTPVGAVLSNLFTDLTQATEKSAWHIISIQKIYVK